MMSMTGKRARVSATGAMIMAAAVAGGAAQAQQVVVQGNSRDDAETVRSYVTGVSPEEGRRNLIASGMFSDVRVAQSGGRIVVTVRENNTINRVVFEGNKKVEKGTLESVVEARSRGAFNPAVVNSDIERIR